jgi:hypothetical protein
VAPPAAGPDAREYVEATTVQRFARFSQILGRTFSRFVPFEPFSFLGSGHGWHDRWSDTRVVRTRGV